MKKNLRKQLISRRQGLSESQVSAASLSIFHQLINNRHCVESSNLAMYVSFKNEIALDLFFQYCLSCNISCFFPVVNGRSLLFTKADNSSQWQKNKYGILEPINNETISPNMLDCVIMPCVGVDKHNFRLGYGVGYYDRLSSQIDCWTIVVAYSFQLCDSIFPDVWDMKVNEVCLAEV